MPDSIDLIKQPDGKSSVPGLIPKDNDYNNVFGTYSNHIYQNFTKIFQTDVNFFIMVPKSLLPYYYYVVLQQLFWFRGYVPGIHNSSIVSQQLGGWICNKVATLTASGGFHVEAEDETVEDELTNLINNKNIVHKLNRRLPMLNAGGFALAYATLEYDADPKDYSKYNIKFVDCNRHFAKVDSEGRVMGFVAHLKTITPDPVKGEIGYYLVHRRWMEKVNGEVIALDRYSVYKGPGWITTPVFESFSEINAVELEVIPDDVKNSFEVYLGKVPLNETFATPFVDNCGASIIHNSHTADGVEEYENFSSGTLFHVINQLYEFDNTKAQKMVNKYMAVTKVLLPDNFYSPPAPQNTSTDPDRYAALSAGYHASFNEKMGHTIFKRVPYVSAHEQSPFFFQAKNESETYNKDIKFLLSEIAAKISLSASTLAPFISEKAGLNQKTAEEVSTEENETRLTVSTKRELISTALELVLKYIAKSAGSDECSLQIIFNNEEVSNPIKELTLIGKRLELKLTSRERALKRANRHLSKREVAKLAKEIEDDENREQELKIKLKEASGSSMEKPKVEPPKPGVPEPK